jgi:hypothetical protein
LGSIAKGATVVILTKRRPLGMTIAALTVLLAALVAPLLAPAATSHAAAPQKPRSQGLVEFALIIALVQVVDTCTDSAGKDIRPCTFGAKITVYSDGSARGGATLRRVGRDIAMDFQKAKLSGIFTAPTAELSGDATVTDERGRTRSYKVRATVTRVGADKLSGSVALDDGIGVQREAYAYMAGGTFK